MSARTSLCLFILGMCALCWPTRSQRADTKDDVLPRNSADIIIPILDLRYKSLQECGVGKDFHCKEGLGRKHVEARGKMIGELVARLVMKRSPAADRAMVVLLHYDVGPSQTEDIMASLMARGKIVLPYLLKYKDDVPRIPGRNYPSGMLNEREFQQAMFRDLISSIQQKTTN